MRIGNVKPTYTFSLCAPTIDAEHKEIMKRLIAYGATPTGDKATDRATLRRIEEQKAKQEKIVTNKYLTVSSEEIQKWIQADKENDISKKTQQEEAENNHEDLVCGAEIMAAYNALLIKKRKKNSEQ